MLPVLPRQTGRWTISVCAPRASPCQSVFGPRYSLGAALRKPINRTLRKYTRANRPPELREKRPYPLKGNSKGKSRRNIVLLPKKLTRSYFSVFLMLLQDCTSAALEPVWKGGLPSSRQRGLDQLPATSYIHTYVHTLGALEAICADT